MNRGGGVVADLAWTAVVTVVLTAVLLSAGGAGSVVFGGDLHGIYLQKFHAAIDSLFVRGELPLWNPMEFNGHPLLGVMQGAVLYPPVWLFFGLFEDWTALQAFYALHYAWLTLGMIRLLKSAGLGPALGAFAALVAMADPVDAGPDADHPMFAAALSWFPWALYALAGAIEKPLRWLPILALASAAQWFAGYPEFPIDAAVLLCVVALVSPSPTRGIFGRLAICVCGIALGAGLAAIQIVPGLETMAESSRSLEEVKQIQAMTLATGSLLPQLPGRIGWAALALCGVAVFAPLRGRWAWLLGGAFCVFALSFPLKLMYRLPPFEMVRFPIGWRLLYPIFLGALAAAGVEQLRLANNRVVRVFGGVLVAWAAVACVLIARGGNPHNPKAPPDPAVLAQRAELMKSFAVGPYRQARFISPWDINSGASLKHDLPTSWGYEPAVNPRRMRRVMKLVRKEKVATLKRWDQSWKRADLAAMLGVGFFAVPRGVARHFERAGFELVAELPDHNLRKGEVLVAREPVPRVRIVHHLLWANDDDRSFEIAVARARDKKNSTVIMGEPNEFPVRWPPRDAVESVSIELSEPREVRLNAELAAPGMVVLSDAYFPGWKAWVNDEPAKIYRADYLFRGIALDAGHYDIRFRYDPRSAQIGAAISVLSVALCVGLLAIDRRRVAS